MLQRAVENNCDKIHGSTNDVRARSLWLLVLFQLVSNVRACLPLAMHEAAAGASNLEHNALLPSNFLLAQIVGKLFGHDHHTTAIEVSVSTNPASTAVVAGDPLTVDDV